jgi:hypothetical protein
MSEKTKKNGLVMKSSLVTLGASMFLVVSVLIGIKSGYEYGWLSGADYGMSRIASVAGEEIESRNSKIEELSLELESREKQVALQEDVLMNFGSLDSRQVNPIGKSNPKNLMLTCDEKNLNKVYCSKDGKQLLSCGQVSLTKLNGEKEISYQEAILETCDVSEVCDQKLNKCMRREQKTL